MRPPPMRVDVAADDGSWIGLGEMRERECWGRDEGGVFWTQIPTNFDLVIWVIVSKDLRLENIQEVIGEKIGLLNDAWKKRSDEQNALDLFRILKGKKFVL
ncbi:hypothetical protein WN943_022636 [Citrus x changshan-huyou]